MKKIVLFFIFALSLFASDINRNIIAFYDSSKGDNERLNIIHESFEVILNYYGYIVDYSDINKDLNVTKKYKYAIFWFSDNISKNPVETVKKIVKLKNEGVKTIIIGSIPTNDSNKSYIAEINPILNSEFGFKIGDIWSDDSRDIRIKSSKLKLNFEKKYGYLDSGFFLQLVPSSNSKFDELISAELISENITSLAAFKAEWGAYANEDKIYFKDASDPNNQVRRWIVNPFEFAKAIFDTSYPIPDVTTKNGKRVAYIHIDGDGAISKSEVIKNDICADVYYQKIAKVYPFKTGVSFIVSELDKKYKGSDSAIAVAKKIYALPYIEAASHTYTHPLNWSKGIVAFTKDSSAKKAMHGTVSAYAMGEVDRDFEIKDSVDFINKLLPVGKTCNSVYWSGDCLPTKKDLEYIKEHNLTAFNGGDSFFDSVKPSYAYLYPLSRYVDGERQIYSTGSNENIYTSLWTQNFWGFARVVETFKNSGSTVRLMPINLYYHFYSLEKLASYNALLVAYRYLNDNKNDLEFIYPTEFIASVEGFFDVKISQNGSVFKISNAKKLHTLRVDGRVNIINQKGVSSFIYDQKQNVTYISINSDDVEFEVVRI